MGVDGGWRKQIGKWSEISVLNKTGIYKRICQNMIYYSWDYDPISTDWNFLQ